MLDLLHIRSREGRWLDELAARRIPILLLFAEDDDGIEFLCTRLARRLRRVLSKGDVTVRELADIDHPMHQEWRRHIVITALVDFLSRIGGAKPPLPQRALSSGTHTSSGTSTRVATASPQDPGAQIHDPDGAEKLATEDIATRELPRR
jgi:hypothetical protein